MAPHPPENRERNCFPFAFWKVPFAFWKVPFAVWKVPFAVWKVPFAFWKVPRFLEGPALFGRSSAQNGEYVDLYHGQIAHQIHERQI